MIKATYIDHMGDDLTVVNSARVSFGKQSKLECIDMIKGKFILSAKDKKLIQYLAKHNHKSPFNHAFATFHVKAPVFVARQLVKHEYMPWNEIRYLAAHFLVRNSIVELHVRYVVVRPPLAEVIPPVSQYSERYDTSKADMRVHRNVINNSGYRQIESRVRIQRLANRIFRTEELLRCALGQDNRKRL